MNILLIGGSGSLINNLIVKLNKEGHRVFLITGSRYKTNKYSKVFEEYNFAYESTCLNEIFESVDPDVCIYMGAFDTNFCWGGEEHEAVRYSTCFANIMMSYAMHCKGRFLYLSSVEVFTGDYPEDICEHQILKPQGYKSMVLAQAEELCESYCTYHEKDILILRFAHLYGMPEDAGDVNDVFSRMCLDAIKCQTITITEESYISPLYEKDAIEAVYQFAVYRNPQNNLYHISSGIAYSERDIAKRIQNILGNKIAIYSDGKQGHRRILSKKLSESELGISYFCDDMQMIGNMAVHMKKNSRKFLKKEVPGETFWEKLQNKTGWFVQVMFPFVENMIAAVIFVLLHSYLGENYLFSKLDFFLLYVISFAIIYGHQQATCSAILSVLGYIGLQLQKGTALTALMDAEIYIWMAQLFAVGFSIGYLRDQLRDSQSENEEERSFSIEQMHDMRDINSSNVRVKDALVTQIVNQSDSVGKIYTITSALEQYSAEEVLFYAAEILAKLMKCKDVAIYTVSNQNYARLTSYTSAKAKGFGNSVRYRELEEVYEVIRENKVYINRNMDKRYPLMAKAIFENEQMMLLVFVWGLSWDRMTLGQANQLTVISALIQNAVLRANRYLMALEKQRYVAGTALMEAEAFSQLGRAYIKAKERGLVECTFLRIIVEKERHRVAGELLAKMLRDSDYIGLGKDGNLYVLLANTVPEDSEFVRTRFKDAGYQTEIVEEFGE